ncbi:MAG: M28 family peptidase [Candidatus Hydrogenedentota bacterium]
MTILRMQTSNSWFLARLIGLGVLTIGTFSFDVSAQEEPSVAMATSPEALIDTVTDSAFLTPDEYQEAVRAAEEAFTFPLDLQPLPQLLDERTDPRAAITAKQIEGFAGHLVSIATKSREDGEILWGRIEGTQYERDAHDWIAATLKEFGLEDVQHDRFPPYAKVWFPTVNRLEITSAPGFEAGATHEFTDAVTPFPSAVTPPGGIEREVIYIGDGTAAELAGRDLSDKIVLVRGRAESSALYSSVRVAYSRIATGKYGMPAAIIVWWAVPGVRQVAGRVGAPGGGDELGELLPWISIGDDDGFYLRKLLDRATPSDPVRVRIMVEGRNKSPEELETGNVYAFLPGISGKYILIHTHVDGYFYGLHDNGASVAAHMAIARHYASKPLEERPHGFIFLFQGGHERTGVGGTRDFVKKHAELLRDDLLMATRLEHFGFVQQLEEGPLKGKTNAPTPLFLTNNNRSPVLIELFKDAATAYGIVHAERGVSFMPTDELAFYPPFNDLGNPVFAGWVQTGKFYHSTADVDLGGISFKEMERIARAHAYIFDRLGPLTLADLRKDETPVKDSNVYNSAMFKLFLGNF